MAPLARTGDASVLVVDDEKDVQLLVRRILEHSGYAVETANDGEEALEKIAACPPDLIVLDLMMPRLDGWGVLDRLRASGAVPRVLLLSAYAHDPLTQKRGLDAGACACLGKPFRLPDLLRSCAQALDGSPAAAAPPG